MLSRKIINTYTDLARRHEKVTVKDLKNKLKLDIESLNHCKQLGVYPMFFIFDLSNVSNKDASSIRKRLLCTAINNRNQELQHILKELSISKNFISEQLSTIDLYILKKSITLHSKKLLQKSLHNQHKKLPLLTRGCCLPIFTAKKTTTNLTQYKFSQEDTNLLKASLYFSIQPDKIRKSEIFTTFKKIHHYFINNLKCKEAKSQINVHLS